MNGKKLLHILAAVLLCICLLVSVCTLAGADFGDFGGDGDYGGGDDGGDFGGWDDDYDSTSYDGDSGDDSLLGIVIAIALIAVIISVSKRDQKKQGASAAATDDGTLTPIANYTALDPDFSEAELSAKLSNLYVQMQQCWTAKDISSLRPYFADAYFAQMERQLDQHRQQHRTNHIDRIAVLYAKPLGYRQLGGNDFIVAELQARIVDYTVSDDNGALLSGSKTAEKLMTYEYTLMRPTGQKTVPETDCVVTNCPNCGAPVNINRTAKCPYCDSIITVNNQSFVISSIRGISQKTL